MRRLLMPAAGGFDTLYRTWHGARAKRWLGNALVLCFLATLLAIEANRRGWLPDGLSTIVPRNHFYAIDLAFTLLLLFEVVALVMSLAYSVSHSVGKQFEIFSLILLRSSFKELTKLDQPIVWEQLQHSILPMLSEMVGALLVFLVLGLYYHLQRHTPITPDQKERASFVATKKVIALLLLFSDSPPHCSRWA
jgi:hypothetical protein